MSVIALFGAAGRGELETAYYCKNLPQLFEHLGEPPEETKGLYFAVQSILYGHPLVYFRVRDEGHSVDDYLYGLALLKNPNYPLRDIQALFLPGVGSKELLDEAVKLSQIRH